MSHHHVPPKELLPGAYWYISLDGSFVICEKRESEDFVRFTNGSRQSWGRAGESFYGPLPTPPAAQA